MKKKPLFTVALSERNWKAIQSLILDGCQQRGGRWVSWGEQIADHIETSIIDQIQAAFDKAAMTDQIETDFDEVAPVDTRPDAPEPQLTVVDSETRLRDADSRVRMDGSTTLNRGRPKRGAQGASQPQIRGNGGAKSPYFA